MREELIEWVQKAQRHLAATKEPAPDFWYESVERQLEFVLSVAQGGGRPSQEDLESMSMGLLAVREFENEYPELAHAIAEVLYRFKRL